LLGTLSKKREGADFGGRKGDVWTVLGVQKASWKTLSYFDKKSNVVIARGKREGSEPWGESREMRKKWG